MAQSVRPSSIGIDLGGTNLKGVIMDGNGVCRYRCRRTTEAHRGGGRVMQNILTLIEDLIEKEGNKDHILGVGIGTPGFVDKDGTHIGGAENIPGWKGTQLYKPIKERFGLRAWAANDVTVAALAESRFGAGRGVKNMVCFALGTGIGGGIVINGHLYEGTHGMAGEIGHIIVETNGVQCTCGLKGCVERYASATGIVYFAKALARDFVAPLPSTLQRIALENPESLSAKLVCDHARAGDPYGIAINEFVCEKLAIAIGLVLNTLSPDRVVLGGGVMMAGNVILDTVKKYVPRYCWPQIAERCDIVAAELGEDAGVMGAAALVFENVAGSI